MPAGPGPNPYAPPGQPLRPPAPARRLHPLAWLGFGLAALGLVGWIAGGIWAGARWLGSTPGAATSGAGTCTGLPAGARTAAGAPVLSDAPPGSTEVVVEQGCDSYEGGDFFYGYRTYRLAGSAEAAADYIGGVAVGQGWNQIDAGVYRIVTPDLVSCLYVDRLDPGDSEGDLSVEIDVTASSADDLFPLCEYGDPADQQNPGPSA